MVGALQANVEVFLAISVLGFASILAFVSLASWRKIRNRRALFIGLGFVALAFKGAFLVQRSYTSAGSLDWLLPVAALDLASLLCLYLALRLR